MMANQEIAAWVRLRRTAAALPWVPIGIVAVMLVGEGLLLAGIPVGTALLDSFLLVALVNWALFGRDAADLATALALVPLTRVLGLVSVISVIPAGYLYLTIGLPLLGGVLIALLRSPDAEMLLATSLHWSDWAFVLAGVPAGLVARLATTELIGRAQATIPVPVLALGLIVAAVAEEIVYRGLILSAATRAFGVVAAVLVSATLFAVLQVASGSIGAVAVAVGIGLLFGAYVGRRRRLIPAIGARVVMVLVSAIPSSLF